MPETKYNIEILFPGEKKYRYANQVSSLHWALIYANKPYVMKVAVKVRIRRVVKTIVWKSKGLKDASNQAHSQAEKA